jgi:hypothetical protein
LAEFLLDVREDNKVDVQFWYTSSDDKSLDLLMGMKDLFEDIFLNIDFIARPVSWACPHCDSEFKEKNCIADGKYCAMQHE